MNENHKETAMYVLGGLVTVGFFSVIFVYMGKDTQDSGVMNLLLGALVAAFTTVLGYFYGSSKSSHDKTKLLDKD